MGAQGPPKASKPAFLQDIKDQQFELHKVSGALQMTLKRIKNKVSTHQQADLLGNLRERIKERRADIYGDSDGEDSEWSVE